MGSFDFLAALLLGLAGSLHCAGMCGPIALALPLQKASMSGRIGRTVVYNTGRAITYAVMGLLFGLFGQGLALAGLQQILSVIIGALMVLSVLLPVLFKKVHIYDSIYNKYMSKLFSSFRKQFGIDTYASFMIIGLLNGLLPCGLVYVALAGALASGHYLSGAFFMFVFGMGTLPMMMGISLAGSSFGAVFKTRIRKIVPYVVIIIGLLFILRGLALGIKYISPKDEKLKLKIQNEADFEKNICH